MSNGPVCNYCRYANLVSSFRDPADNSGVIVIPKERVAENLWSIDLFESPQKKKSSRPNEAGNEARDVVSVIFGAVYSSNSSAQGERTWEEQKTRGIKMEETGAINDALLIAGYASSGVEY